MRHLQPKPEIQFRPWISPFSPQHSAVYDVRKPCSVFIFVLCHFSNTTFISQSEGYIQNRANVPTECTCSPEQWMEKKRKKSVFSSWECCFKPFCLRRKWSQDNRLMYLNIFGEMSRILGKWMYMQLSGISFLMCSLSSLSDYSLLFLMCSCLSMSNGGLDGWIVAMLGSCLVSVSS